MEAAFAAHSDLHSGWEPTATVQTQLCTGDADKQVPATISLEAAERWPSASLIVLPGRGHNDAIVECSRLGLLNLTASLGVVAARTAARAPVILAPSNATLLYDGGGAAPAPSYSSSRESAMPSTLCGEPRTALNVKRYDVLFPHHIGSNHAVGRLTTP